MSRYKGRVKLKKEGLRVFATAFAIAVVGYVLLFYVIERRRPQRGPWTVTFDAKTNGVASLVINQHRLGITNVQVSLFLTNAVLTEVAEDVRFDFARQVPFALPFGRCLFLDTTFLPGTVTLQLGQHELELLPRVLIIDHKEHVWRSNAKIDLTPGSP